MEIFIILPAINYISLHFYATVRLKISLCVHGKRHEEQLK